ncbi:hypothetical protein ACRAWC_14085 [Leifsonia sp. L25]|uniref:hypothetical protein n=1 Tax=Leifsonia sp. L25 TaxID=3423957 RepID=UPI003D694E9E
MKIILDSVAKGARDAALPATSVAFETGQAALSRAETEQRPTVLGLIASGRMRPDSGTVTIDGRTDFGAMRRRIALVDAPDVCEPASDVTVAGIVAEELMFAGLASHPLAVRRRLAGLGAGEYARYAIGTVPPTVLIRLLTELALLRKDVEGVVIVSPTGTAVTLWSGGGSRANSPGAASPCSSSRAMPPPRRSRRPRSCHGSSPATTTPTQYLRLSTKTRHATTPTICSVRNRAT